MEISHQIGHALRHLKSEVQQIHNGQRLKLKKKLLESVIVHRVNRELRKDNGNSSGPMDEDRGRWEVKGTCRFVERFGRGTVKDSVQTGKTKVVLFSGTGRFLSKNGWFGSTVLFCQIDTQLESQSESGAESVRNQNHNQNFKISHPSRIGHIST